MLAVQINDASGSKQSRADGKKLTLIQIVDNMDDRDSQVKYLLLQKKHVNINTDLCTSAAARHKQSSKTALRPLKATKTQASQISSYTLYAQRHSYIQFADANTQRRTTFW
jgi:hypothetical protein